MADAGTLTAKLTLDTADFSKGANEAEGLANGLAGKVGVALGGVASAVGAAVTAAATAVGTLVKDASTSFAEYEQLVGGGKLVFGDAFGYIEDRAAEAYKNVGMSQNEYLQQVNGFAVGLKEALGGSEEEAAKLADRIVTAETDVVAAMGISQEAAQNAFNGIMKGNFTMVDNLMLGIKPTKEGFQEMIDKVNEWNAAQGHATQYTMDNLADMQSALVDYIEKQGIAGYAANEAGDTIQGSLSMVKAAWENVILSVAGGGPALETTIGQFTESVKTFVSNIMPILQEAMYGIGDLVRGIVPIISQELPGLVESIVPALVDTVMELTQSIISVLPQVVNTIVSAATAMIPQLVSAFISLLDSLMTSILPAVFSLAIELIIQLGNGLSQNVGQLMSSLAYLIDYIIMEFLNHLPELIEVGLKLILAIAEGLLYAMPQIAQTIMDAIPAIVQAILTSLPAFLQIGVKIILAVAEGILLAVPMLLVSFLRAIGVLEKSAQESQTNLVNGITDTSAQIDTQMEELSSKYNKSTQQVSTDAKQLLEASDKSSEELDKAANEIIATGMAAKHTMNDVTSGIIVSANIAKSGVADAFREMADAVGSAANQIAAYCASINSSFSSISGPSVSMGGISGHRASGGPVSAGQVYMTGEQGRELFMAPSDGYIYSHEDTEDILGGSGTISITIQGDVYDDERSMTKKLRSAMMTVLEEQVAYG